MKANAIAVASSNFIHDEASENGLMIMGLPTGIGKTHGNCVMMLDEIERNDDNSFIYITEQNKNLQNPYDTLREIACGKKDGYGWTAEQFEAKVLWLKSNVDMFDQGYKDELRFQIDRCFKDYGADRGVLNRLLDARKAYGRVKDKNYDKAYKDQLYEAYRSCEADFRKEIRKILRKFPSRDIRIQKIGSEENLRWIAKVYKVIRFKDARIILMSDKKFTHTIDPLVSAPFCIWEETDLRVSGDGRRHSVLSDHVIVIDEFDTFKRVLEDHLIEDNEKQMDAIRAFRNCSLRIPAWKNLPLDIQKESGWWNRERQRYSIEDRFNNLIEKGNRIKSEYRTQNLFKLFAVNSKGGFIDPSSSSFMFRDYEPNIIGNAFTLKTEDGDKYNRILSGRSITANPGKMNGLFKSLDGYFDMLCRLVRDLSFNFMSNAEEAVAQMVENKDPVRYGDERTGLIYCVDSVIDAFDMEEDLARYVKNRVLHNRLKTNRNNLSSLPGSSMYSRGFRYVDMKDSISKQLQTHMYYTDYDTTPEYILRHMCEVTKVIGMSATGEIESPLCNFSLQYLRESGIHIHEYPQSDIEALGRLMESNKQGYIEGEAEVDVHILDVDPSYSQMSWESMFDPMTAKRLYNEIGHISEKESDDYPESRYIRLTKVVEEFIERDDIQSMLCFFSAHAKSLAGTTFQIEKIDKVLNVLAEKHDTRIEVEWAEDVPHTVNPDGSKAVVLMQITGESYETKKQRMFERLEKNEKVMVLTAYQTLGAGQNLQYGIPADFPESELVWVRDPKVQSKLSHEGEEKDFDAIYLDEPTSVGPKIEKNDKGSLDRYLFYAEYADASGRIELDDKRKQIAQAFTYCYNPSIPGHPKHFKDTQIYALAKGKIIVQAIGRADRTGWKRRTTHIFLDRRLANGGAFALEKERYGMFRSRLFDEVYDAVHEEGSISEDEKKELKLLTDNAVRRSHCIVCRIDDIRDIMYGGDPSAIAEWKAWREFVLKHPTGPKVLEGLSGYERELYTYGYVDLPEESDRCWFCQKEDFRSDSTDGLEIHFGKPRKLKSADVEKVPQCVSSESARLDLMLRIDGVRGFLEDRGYATEFAPGAKILSPPLFRNIYMGALGEVVGKYLLERDFGLNGCIREMDEVNYEQFDNMLDSGAAIDFKDWNERFLTDGKAKDWQLRKIARKMSRCKVSRVYILNVVLDSEAEYQPVIRENVDKGEIVIVPYLYKVGKKGVLFNHGLERILSEEVKQ